MRNCYNVKFQSLFLWKCFWNQTRKPSSGGGKNVSILVFMEVFLEWRPPEPEQTHMIVSILVFMEVFLESLVIVVEVFFVNCFNPCFYGSVSGISFNGTNGISRVLFQSLFLWKCFWNLKTGLLKVGFFQSFNPCFYGSVSGIWKVPD